MKRLSIPLFTALLGGSLLVAGNLAAQTDLTEAVERRQELMKTMGGTFRTTLPVFRGESTDLAAAGEAAQTGHDAIAEAITLFVEGTARGEVEGSRAKPEIWTEREDFEAAANALMDAFANLAAAADTGDIDQFKAAFQPLGRACGGCHEGPREEGGKFRFPEQG